MVQLHDSAFNGGSMIQHLTFETGGFVLHKIIINGQKYSAWFDVNGKILAAERIATNGTVMTVPSYHRHVLEEIHKIGQRYVWNGNHGS